MKNAWWNGHRYIPEIINARFTEIPFYKRLPRAVYNSFNNSAHVLKIKFQASNGIGTRNF